MCVQKSLQNLREINVLNLIIIFIILWVHCTFNKYAMSFTCFHCSKQFSSKNRVKDHIIEKVCLRKIHLCWCGKGCVSPKALKVHTLRHHTTRTKLITTPLKFENLAQFELWKQAMEEETVAKFVKPRTFTKLKNGNKKTKYVCHRSGKIRLKEGERKRAARKKGSCKLNANCPAFISIEEDVNGVIKGEFYGTHCNHKNDIHHLTLTQREKIKIADDLNRGATFEEILDDIKNSFINEKYNYPKRIHMLTRKDLHNIMQEYKISFKERLAKDATNVHLLVQECEKRFGEKSPVKLFKPQNVDGIERMEGANPEDFILIIMTSTQKEMIVESVSSQICVDTTYGTKGFDFHLTTVLTIDDCGLSFPVAYCISNTVNEKIMTIFFSTLMRECGNVRTSIFTSKDFPPFINAWCKVMSVPEKWQVDKNLQQNLQKVNVLIELKTELETKIKMLMEELDDQVFVSMLKKFVTKLSENESTKVFGQFFENEYMRRPSKWAYDYRKHGEIHANLKLEAMHRVLKDVYFKGLKVRRLDFSIFRLLKMCWDSLFDRLTGLTKENDVYSLKILRDRHNASLSISMDSIVKKDYSYEIESLNDCDRTIVVNFEKIDCSCRLRCLECDTCLHVYSCSCIDYRIAGNFCKHVHAVNLFEKNMHNSIICEDDGLICEIPKKLIGSMEDIPNLSLENENNFNEKKKQELIDALLHMTHLLQTNVYESSIYDKGAKFINKALQLFYKAGLPNSEKEESPDKLGESYFLSSEKNNFEIGKIVDEEATSEQIQLETVNQILVDDVVEEIVYVDVHTTYDTFF